MLIAVETEVREGQNGGEGNEKERRELFWKKRRPSPMLTWGGYGKDESCTATPSG